MAYWLLRDVPLCSLSVCSCVSSPSGDSGSQWVKHWVKGGHNYYYNLDSKEGTWVEPEGFEQNNTQLNKDEIQVGYCVPDGWCTTAPSWMSSELQL